MGKGRRGWKGGGGGERGKGEGGDEQEGGGKEKGRRRRRRTVGRWCAWWWKARGGGGGRGKHGYLEIWDGVLAVVFIGEQALKLFIRLLAARQVAGISCGAPCTHKPFSQTTNGFLYILRIQTFVKENILKEKQVYRSCTRDCCNVLETWKVVAGPGKCLVNRECSKSWVEDVSREGMVGQGENGIQLVVGTASFSQRRFA